MRAWLSLGSALVACRNVSLCPSLFLFDLSAGPRTCEACVDGGGNGLGRRECSSRLFGSSLMSTGNDKQWQMEAAAFAVGSGVYLVQKLHLAALSVGWGATGPLSRWGHHATVQADAWLRLVCTAVWGSGKLRGVCWMALTVT